MNNNSIRVMLDMSANSSWSCETNKKGKKAF